MKNVFLLPPKMAQQFADRAKRGEGKHLGSIVEFYHGRQRITLVCLDPPQGHIYRMSDAEMKAHAAAQIAAEDGEIA